MNAVALSAELAKLAYDYVRECLLADDEALSAADFARDYLDVALSDVDEAGVARIVRALGDAYETVSECTECGGGGVVDEVRGGGFPRRVVEVECEECGGRGRLHERPEIVLGYLTPMATLDVAAE